MILGVIYRNREREIKRVRMSEDELGIQYDTTPSASLYGGT
jgi:hypothetical protein